MDQQPLAMAVLDKPKAPPRNGVVAMPIKKVTVTLDSIGYEGWWVTFRTNPPASDYDKFLSNEPDVAWEGLQKLILDWNFGDEEGNALPLPKDGLQRDILPYDIQRFLVMGYIDEFNKASGLPKASEDSSEGTSQTSNGL